MTKDFIKQSIDLVGHAILMNCTCETNQKINLCYTIGLKETYGTDEVCLVGLNPNSSMGLINYFVANHIDQLKKENYNKKLSEIFNFDTILLPVDENNKELFTNFDELSDNQDFEFVQLVVTDDKGKFIFEEGYNQDFDYCCEILGSVNISLL